MIRTYPSHLDVHFLHPFSGEPFVDFHTCCHRCSFSISNQFLSTLHSRRFHFLLLLLFLNFLTILLFLSFPPNPLFLLQMFYLHLQLFLLGFILFYPPQPMSSPCSSSHTSLSFASMFSSSHLIPSLTPPVV